MRLVLYYQKDLNLCWRQSVRHLMVCYRFQVKQPVDSNFVLP